MDAQSLVSLFSWSDAHDRLYRQLIPASGRTVDDVAAVLHVEPEELRIQIVPMIERGIVSVDDDGVLSITDPANAVNHMIRMQGHVMKAMGEELGRIGSVLPALLDAGPFAPRSESNRVAGEVEDGGDNIKLLSDWIRGSSGDISILRPDDWRSSRGGEIDEALAQALASGRQVRVIYPSKALTEVPEVLDERVRLGEQVRVAPEVITRMCIVGVWRALLPEPLGVGSDRRVVMRQPAVVQLCQAWFDLMWDRANPVLEPQTAQDRRTRRRVLLAQLASGVKDEQIARNLDVSLRTVRRGVADLLVELGVDTRFQAGVEAVRRGWL